MLRLPPRPLWQFSDSMMKTKPIGLYVHIPFCLKKCGYCDFCSFSDLDENVRKAYIKRLIEEIFGYRDPKEKISVDTVFFGGGTPSLLTPEEFSKICDAIKESFEILPNTEFTLEANPKTLTREKLDLFRAFGINRISIGLQTIHENELKILGRIHSFEDFKTSYQLVLDAGFENIGIDLMYGIPGQTAESFKETLMAAVSFNPSHISAYSLILEEGTEFWEKRHSLTFPDEDTECEMYELATRVLSENGYNHYEISNYARPNFESRHNLKYWRGEEYVGVGVAAYSYFNGVRFGNSRSLSEYLSENAEQYIVREMIDPESRAYEYAMLRLRLSEGFPLEEYKMRFGSDFLIGREEKIDELSRLGYLKNTGGRIAFTEKGFYVSNSILTELL